VSPASSSGALWVEISCNELRGQARVAGTPPSGLGAVLIAHDRKRVVGTRLQAGCTSESGRLPVYAPGVGVDPWSPSASGFRMLGSTVAAIFRASGSRCVGTQTQTACVPSPWLSQPASMSSALSARTTASAARLEDA